MLLIFTLCFLFSIIICLHIIVDVEKGKEKKEAEINKWSSFPLRVCARAYTHAHTELII